MGRSVPIILHTALLGILFSGLSQAATIHVPSEQPTIQAGIDAAVDGDTVLVAPGVYVGDIDFKGKSIVVTSSSGASETTLDRPIIGFDQGEDSATILSGFEVVAGFVGLYNGSRPVISNNVFHTPNGKWVVIDCDASSPTIRFNLFYNCGGNSCIGVERGAPRIINNTFDGNARGFYDLWHGSIVYNNIITNSSEYGVFYSIDSLDYNNFWNNHPNYDGNAVPGAHDISVNPMFVDPAARDYSLLPMSPCINAGHPDPKYNDWDGSRNDMGAFPLVHTIPFAIDLNPGTVSIYHVIDHTPTFSWSFFDTVGSQSGYDIEIGTDRDWSAAEVWSSGEVISADTFVTCQGTELQDGASYYYRVRIFNGLTWGTWVYSEFRMNSVPTAPIPVFPLEGDFCSVHSWLLLSRSADQELDKLSYDVEVSSDPGFISRVDSIYGVMGEGDTVRCGPLARLNAGETYWWRGRAFDGYEFSEWNAGQVFLSRDAETINVPGDWPTIQEGITAAAHLDTVLAAPGIYEENLDFQNKAIVLLGALEPGGTILRPSHPDTPAVRIEAVQFAQAKLGRITFDASTRHNIRIRAKSRVEVESIVVRNLEQGSSSNALRIYHGSQVYLSHSLFYDNGGLCVYITDSSKCVLTNNTFDANYRSIYATAGTTIKNNIISNSSDYGVRGSPELVDFNDVWNNTRDYVDAAAGPHDISVNPMYVDPTASDYRLNLLSPCIDAGDPDTKYDDPDGSRNDLGAYPSSQGGTDLPIPSEISFGNENRSHVLNHSPIIYWSYSGSSGSGQVAYEIEVGNDTDWVAAEKWATGQVNSVDTAVMYMGSLLSDGETCHLRIRVHDGSNWGSWRHIAFRMNSPPTIPIPLYPIAGDEVLMTTVKLKAQNGSDQEGDSLMYDFEVYSDAQLNDLAEHDYSVMEQVDTTRTKTLSGLLNGSRYWWRTRCYDGYEYSSWSYVVYFVARALGSTVRVPQDQSTIQAGIDAAMNGDTVLVAPGTYRGTGNRDIELRGKTILVMATAGPFGTTIDCEASGNDRHRGFQIYEGEDSLTVIDGFTVINGVGDYVPINYYFGGSSEGGAGMAILGASPRIRNCRFVNLKPVDREVVGGAIVFINSQSIVENCVFVKNGFSRPAVDAVFGGAIGAESSSLILDGCVFVDNRAGVGGAIAGENNDIAIRNCTFARNAGFWGGTFAVGYSHLDISESVLAFGLRDTLSRSYNSTLNLSCSNLYGNVGGDFVREFAPFANSNGNYSANPLFCSLPTSQATVFDSSPLLPENNDCGVLVGANGAGCTQDARNWYLDPSGGGDAPTIQDAINQASNGDTIFLAAGTYWGDGNRDIDFGGKAIVVTSTHGPEYTQISCGGYFTRRHRGFVFITGESNDSKVSGVTITDGYAPADDYPTRDWDLMPEMGGGILCLGSSPTIEDCVIRDCSAISLFRPTSQILSGGTGGGIAAEHSGIVIKRCIVRGNRAAEGAGLHLYESPVFLDSCQIVFNYGVGVFNGWTNASRGAGLFLSNSTALIRHTRIQSNFVHGGRGDFPPIPFPGDGAGAYLYGNSATFRNCTITGNGAYQRTDLSGGSGFPATFKSAFRGAGSQVYNSIIFGPIGGVPTFSCSNLNEWNDDIIDQLGVNGNFSADPKFCTDFSLYEDSPCAPANSPCGELVGSEPVGCVLACGNVNSDVNGIDILDLVYLLDYAFRNGPSPLDKANADLDGSGDINIADINYLVSYLFRNGPAPTCQ